MSAPEVAADHYARRQRLVDATGEAAARAWAQVDPARIADSWAAQVPEMTVVVSGAQLAAARPADTYTDAVLDDLDVDAESLGDVDPSGFSGRASDGRSLQGLLANPAIVALMAIQDGADVARALASGRANLDMLVRTQVADAGRLADQVAITARPKAAGYVRMAVGNSCARCLILSGRFYRWNTGFQRHPRCDCVHIPSGQLQVARVKLPSPEETYARMTAGQRTAAGLSLADQEAIALGSDLNQVVNARRGLFTAGGRKFTHVNARVAPRGARMSVDQIFRDATGRDDAIRLLRRNGYLTSAPTRAATPVPPTAGERLKGLLGKEPAAVRQLGGGEMADTRLLTYADGTQAVEKIYGRRVPGTAAEIKHQLDAEELAVPILEAMGIRVPAVVRDGDRRLLMEYLDGDVGADIVPWGSNVPVSIASSDDGRLLGLADLVMANGDRHAGNWLRLRDGRLAGIDHGEAFRFQGWPGAVSELSDYLTETRVITTVVGSSIDLHPADVALIRQRLATLRPEFEKRRRLGWYHSMMRLLKSVESGATGTKRRLV